MKEWKSERELMVTEREEEVTSRGSRPGNFSKGISSKESRQREEGGESEGGGEGEGLTTGHAYELRSV